ncbi:hypothetical protein OG21DRAFT_1501665 [Imleria badia]|nr:hypothetical protein OG21DRAFT_1501665 [Imleria badia]
MFILMPTLGLTRKPNPSNLPNDPYRPLRLQHLCALLITIDALRGPEREDARQRALGVNSHLLKNFTPKVDFLLGGDFRASFCAREAQLSDAALVEGASAYELGFDRPRPLVVGHLFYQLDTSNPRTPISLSGSRAARTPWAVRLTPKATTDAPVVVAPPREAYPEALAGAQVMLDAHLVALYVSLPARTAVVILTGHSGSHRMVSLNVLKVAFGSARKDGKKAGEVDSSECWTASDEDVGEGSRRG